MPCEEVLSLQPTMIPPKRFDIFPLTGGSSESLHAFRFSFKDGLKSSEKQPANCFRDLESLLLHILALK